MRRIAIVGAGQAGLQLALALNDRNYDVTLLTARTAEEIRGGRVASTQCMFHDAVQLERDLGINQWDGVAPSLAGNGVTIVAPDGSRAVNWLGLFDAPGQAVDQRIKFADWLELLAARGGRVEHRAAEPADLDALTREHDLVLVSTGRGGLADVFERDPVRSVHVEPPRHLAICYVRPYSLRPEHPREAVWFNVRPGIGELFMVPGHTFGGPCMMTFMEAVPGGPMDVFGDRPGPHEQWRRMKQLLREHFPWEHARLADAELTDERGTFAGRFTPVVRRPVARMPGGGAVLGLADAVVANDPLTGQGSNSAAKAADSYLRSIVERGDEPFDVGWMHRTFERYWEYGRVVTEWTNLMLRPPEHVVRLLSAGQHNDAVARRVVNGFNDPADYPGWFLDADSADRYLQAVAA